MLIPNIPRTRKRFVQSGLATLLACSAIAVAAAPEPEWAPTEPPVLAAQPIALRLQDFFQMPVGDKGLVVSEQLHQAKGQHVRLVGYVVQQEVATLGQFLLTPRPVLMSQHADGEADDLPPATVFVRLAHDKIGPWPTRAAWSRSPAPSMLVAKRSPMAVCLGSVCNWRRTLCER